MAHYLLLNSQPSKEDKKAKDDDKEDDDDDFDLFGSDEEEEDEEVCQKINRTFHVNSMHRRLMCVSILHEHRTLLHPLSILGYLILTMLVSFARKKRRGKQDLHNMRPRKPKVSICICCTL